MYCPCSEHLVCQKCISASNAHLQTCKLLLTAAGLESDTPKQPIVRGVIGVQVSPTPQSASPSVQLVPATMRTGISRLEGCPFCGLQLDDSVALVAHCETMHSVVQGYISVH